MFICLVGFIMGFTLEPHQKAYQQAFAEEKKQITASFDGYAFENRDKSEETLDKYLASAQSALIKEGGGAAEGNPDPRRQRHPRKQTSPW